MSANIRGARTQKLMVAANVSTSGRPLPVKVVARRCGLNLSTTDHLVRTLSYEVYLDRGPDGSYSMGSRGRAVGRAADLAMG